MIAVDYPGGPVAICIPSPGRGGYLMFEHSLSSMQAPIGSGEIRCVGASIAKNCNEALAIGMESGKAAAFWLVDDDHSFNEFTLLRLLARKLPIVTVLTCKKYPPFLPALYKEKQDDGEWVAYDWHELTGKTGLLEVRGAGRAGMLLSRTVVARMGPEVFRMGQGVHRDEAGEDFDFCDRARELGYKIMADLDTTMGHIDHVSVTPTRQADGRYFHMLSWWGGANLLVSPRPQKPPLEAVK